MLLLNNYLYKRIIAVLECRKKYLYSLSSVRSMGVNKLRCILGSKDHFSIKDKLEYAIAYPYSIEIISDRYYANSKIVESVMNNRHTIYGTTRCFDTLEEKWNVDFKTGYRWVPGRFYLRYPIVDYASKSDIKYPWEISRCHHLLLLGQAYLITKEEKYAQKVVNEILGWLSVNPFMYSVNWVCAMDVAIRAANWIHAVRLIIDSEAFNNPKFQSVLLDSLVEHAYYIEKNLEKGKPYSGNHYIADLVGLIHIYLLLDNKKDKLNRVVEEFQNEIRSQVLPSGFHFEKSTSYHKLVLEMILHTCYQLQANKIALDEDVICKIKAMTHFMRAIIQPDGNIPFIADNDNGRFLPYDSNLNFAEGMYILNLANKVFPDENYTTIQKSMFDPDSNLAVLRNNNWYATIHNNPISRYQHKDSQNDVYNSHTHCDMLSFTLSDGTRNLIVDPGSFCYTSSPKQRMKFRSTPMHNTICVDGMDQQKQDGDRLFSLKQFSFPLNTEMTKENTFKGEYEYRNGTEVLYCHQRLFSIEEDGCVVIDNILPIGNRCIKAYFHLSPGVQVSISDNGCLSLHISQSDYKMFISSGCDYNITIEEGVVSPAYGEQVKAPVIVVDLGTQAETVELRTVIKALRK